MMSRWPSVGSYTLSGEIKCSHILHIGFEMSQLALTLNDVMQSRRKKCLSQMVTSFFDHQGKVPFGTAAFDINFLNLGLYSGEAFMITSQVVS